MTARLKILSSKADSNTCESFTRSGLKLESVHQESPCSDIFRKRATNPLLKQKHLTWAKEKKTGLLLSGPKSSFQMKVNFAFHLEVNVWTGGRLEQHRISCLKSSLKFPKSVMIWGAKQHLLMLVHFVLSITKSMQPSTRRYF